MTTELDPQLPYITVHRSVGPKAAQLAATLGVTYAHARGALVILWEALADRRLLAKYAYDTADGPKLALPADDLATRLLLAFGQPVDLAIMESLGFVEPRPDGSYRVRGGSRLLAPEARRLAIKRGRGGGGGKSPASGPEVDLNPTCDPPATHPHVDLNPTSDPLQHPRGERREVRGERREVKDERREPKPRAPSEWETLFEDTQLQRYARLEELGEPPDFEVVKPALVNATLKRLFASLTEVVPGADRDDFLIVWHAYLQTDWGAKYSPPYPLSAFAGKAWPRLVAGVHGTDQGLDA